MGLVDWVIRVSGKDNYVFQVIYNILFMCFSCWRRPIFVKKIVYNEKKKPDNKT